MTAITTERATYALRALRGAGYPAHYDDLQRVTRLPADLQHLTRLQMAAKGGMPWLQGMWDEFLEEAGWTFEAEVADIAPGHPEPFPDLDIL